MGADDFAVAVLVGADPQVVDVDGANYVLASQFGVLVFEELVAPPRNNKLVLARLAAVDFVVAVEEGPVADQKRHLDPLVHHFEAVVVGQARDPHAFLVARQLLVKVLEELNELFWLNVISSDFKYSQGRISIPPLMHKEFMFFIFVYYWNLMSNREEMLGHF